MPQPQTYRTTRFRSQHYSFKTILEVKDTFQEPEIFSGPKIMSHDSNWAMKRETTSQKGRLRAIEESERLCGDLS